MTVEQLRRVLKARPFAPFHIHLADSRTILVKHPELVAFSGSGRTIHVFEDSVYEEIIHQPETRQTWRREAQQRELTRIFHSDGMGWC